MVNAKIKVAKQLNTISRELGVDLQFNRISFLEPNAGCW